ncbi:hypothetical protein BG004_008255 [Podila humilis]|nr:hypothetical protein BG004_008255 [Podila humilis]
MFNVLSWIRSSDATQASSKPNTSSSPTSTSTPQQHNIDRYQDDWVFLPSDPDSLMEASCANLDFLSSSTMTLHPASSRTRGTASADSSNPSVGLSSSSNVTEIVEKSRRQLKREQRLQLAQEQMERKPRYDPFIAKLRDQEFKRAKLAKLALRSGRIMSSTTGGAHSIKGMRGASAAGTGAARASLST